MLLFYLLFSAKNYLFPYGIVEITTGSSKETVDDEIRIGCSPVVGVDDEIEVDSPLDTEVLINSDVVENFSLDEVNSVVESSFPISDVDIDGVIETVVVDLVVGDIVVGVSVDTFEAIEVSVETVDSVDEAVEVSVGSGGMDSSVDIVGRAEAVDVEASVDGDVGWRQSRR